MARKHVLDKTVSTLWDLQTWKMTENTLNIENIVQIGISGLNSTKNTENMCNRTMWRKLFLTENDWKYT